MKNLVLFAAVVLMTSAAQAAIPPSKFQVNKAQYKVNLRVNLKGQNPFSINTVAKPGKKAFISEFSDDGQVETLVALVARKTQSQNKDGLVMDVLVTRRVRGQEKISERAQIFAPENEEMEFGVNSRGKMAGNLSLAVMAHKL
jgi:hypothetical protein